MHGVAHFNTVIVFDIVTLIFHLHPDGTYRLNGSLIRVRIIFRSGNQVCQPHHLPALLPGVIPDQDAVEVHILGSELHALGLIRLIWRQRRDI